MIGYIHISLWAGDVPEVSEQKAISAAVEKRLEGLDEFFMAALDGFVQAAQQQSEPEFAGAP